MAPGYANADKGHWAAAAAVLSLSTEAAVCDVGFVARSEATQLDLTVFAVLPNSPAAR